MPDLAFGHEAVDEAAAAAEVLSGAVDVVQLALRPGSTRSGAMASAIRWILLSDMPLPFPRAVRLRRGRLCRIV